MAFPFFRALNPISKHSGITYGRLAGDHPCHGHEMIDDSPCQGIINAFLQDYYYLSALRSTYLIIVGEHYDLYLKGRLTAHGGSKGLLDFLIFPLIARKLIADIFLLENHDNRFLMLLTMLIGLPNEFYRLFLGMVLTITISPFVLLIHFIKRSYLDYFYSQSREDMIRADNELHVTPFFAEVIPELPPTQPDYGENDNKICHLEHLEIPKEYICPLTLHIMTDPVYVKAHPDHRFEKKWIEEHLRTSRTHDNPLNRDYLRLEDLVEDTEMKAQIERFIEEKLSQNLTL